MRECTLEKARLHDIAFVGCDLADTRFDHADAADVEIVRSDLRRSRFHGTVAARLRIRRSRTRGMRGTHQALYAVEAPTLPLEDLPCPP